MGNSKSQEYSSLVKHRDSSQWIVLQDKDVYEVWINKATSKKYIVYPIDASEIESEQKLQLYNFRQQNHANLVTIQCILIDYPTQLCSTYKNCYLLVEFIPMRLNTFRHTLTFQESLTVLDAALMGYSVLNYIYGPLLTSQEMICFNEQGRPKVWINENLSLNEPCKKAKMDQSTIKESNTLSQSLNAAEDLLKSKTYECLRYIFKIVEDASIQNFPVEFMIQFGKIRNFDDGQQLISNYCRKNNIKLNQNISLTANRAAGPSLALHTDKAITNGKCCNLFANDNFRFTRSNQKEYTPIYSKPGIIKPPISICSNYLSPRNTCAANNLQLFKAKVDTNPKIQIMYNKFQTINAVKSNQIGEHPQVPHISAVSIQSQDVTRERKISIQDRMKLNYKRQKERQKDIEKEARQNKGQQHQNINYQQACQTESIQFSSLRSLHHNVLDALANGKMDQQAKLNQLKHLQPSIELNHMMSHLQKQNKNKGNITNTPQSRNSLNFQQGSSLVTIQELKLWEASLFKQSSQKFNENNIERRRLVNYSEDEHNTSEERDKVLFESQHESPIYQFTNPADLQQYIHQKYGEYMANASPNIQRKLDFSEELSVPNHKGFNTQQISYKLQESREIKDSINKTKAQSFEGNKNKNAFKKQSNSIIKPISIPNSIVKKYEGNTLSFGSALANLASKRSDKLISSRAQETTDKERPAKRTKTNISSHAHNSIEQRYIKYVKNRKPTTTKVKQSNEYSSNNKLTSRFNNSFGKTRISHQNKQQNGQKEYSKVQSNIASNRNYSKKLAEQSAYQKSFTFRRGKNAIWN